jgi:hypothetical protein
MYNTPTGHAVRASLRTIAANKAAPSASDTDALKKLICAAVDELKGMGWPIERIIIHVKEVASEAGLPRHSDPAGREAIVSDVVRWCIDRYFGK